MHVPSPTEYLDSQSINYELVPHATSFTAQETAQKTHIKGNTLSKVVVVGDQNKLALVVIPANCILLQRSLARVLRSPGLNIVPEYQFRDRFPECEIGAMPPFGNLYGMDVFIAKELVQRDTVTFNGGTHNVLIKMETTDFIKVTNARVITVGYKVAGLAQPIISRRKDDWHWA
ncbi:aminoacyl-tRNA deacylase [Aliikangiella coralliicola]|nr:YbaK/EbsC family protein [Aliikangiella coralliicola]